MTTSLMLMTLNCFFLEEQLMGGILVLSRLSTPLILFSSSFFAWIYRGDLKADGKSNVVEISRKVCLTSSSILGSKLRGPISAKRGIPVYWLLPMNPSFSAVLSRSWGMACTHTFLPMSSMEGWKHAPVQCSMTCSPALLLPPFSPPSSGMLYHVQFSGIGSILCLS